MLYMTDIVFKGLKICYKFDSIASHPHIEDKLSHLICLTLYLTFRFKFIGRYYGSDSRYCHRLVYY